MHWTELDGGKHTKEQTLETLLQLFLRGSTVDRGGHFSGDPESYERAPIFASSHGLFMTAIPAHNVSFSTASQLQSVQA